MVGYKHNDTLTSNQKLIAGCVSGCMTRFITQPLDVIKLRTQLVKTKKRKRVYKVLLKIFREEGMTAFWSGHNIGQVHSVLAVSSQFYVFELSTKLLYEHANIDKKYRHITSFICGTLSGCISVVLVNPFDVIRIRQIMAKEQYGGLLKGVRKVYQSGGIRAFYEGITASVLQVGPSVGISFAVFNFVQKLLLHNAHHTCDSECKHTSGNKHTPQDLVLSSSIAGSAAAFVSKTLTYPFDLAKRRLQIASHIEDKKYKVPSTSKHLMKCNRLTECLKVAYQKEGLWGLYRGWSITMYKAQVTSVVAFTTYELVCFALREVDS